VLVPLTTTTTTNNDPQAAAVATTQNYVTSLWSHEKFFLLFQFGKNISSSTNAAVAADAFLRFLAAAVAVLSGPYQSFSYC